MKIALFHNLPIGGGLRYLQETTKFLTKQNILDVYTINNSPKASFNYANNIKAFNFKKIKPNKGIGRIKNDFKKFLTLSSLHKKIAQKINNQNYNLVLVYPSQETQAPYILKYLNKPTIYICNEPPRSIYEKKVTFYKNTPFFKKKYDQIIKYVLKKIDLDNAKSSNIIIVNSSFSAKRIFKIYQKQPFICFPGVNPQKFRPKNIKKKHWLISVGNIEPQKNQLFLLNALKELDLQKKPKLLLIGHKQNEIYTNFLIEKASKYNINLKIINNISDHQLVKIYNQSKICLCAAHKEPFGLTVLEALACETPVIAVNEGGFKETIKHNETGILTSKDKYKFSQKIKLLLENDKERNKLGKNGRKDILKNWTWKESYNQLKNVINNNYS
jgi:glycosyltransferase involved in cell wall biosynthesis